MHDVDHILADGNWNPIGRADRHRQRSQQSSERSDHRWRDWNQPGSRDQHPFFSCTSAACDIGAGSNVFINNFFSTSFEATGGTAPYTWSGNPPAGFTLRPSGLLLGTPPATGTSIFAVTVTDATGAQATGNFSLNVTNTPAPSPNGCPTGPTAKISLSGSTFNGKTPRGEALVDESKFSACGGFSILSVQVSDVNLSDGTQLWVTFDGLPVGMITLRGGSGAMPNYDLGRFGSSRNVVRVFSALPDMPNFQQILVGGPA